MAPLDAFASGIAFGLSLIVAIGPQNLFVLRQGICRTHVPLVVGICTASDVALIALGVGGGATAIHESHRALVGLRVAGALFVLGYALLAARRALFPKVASAAVAESAPATEATAAVAAGSADATGPGARARASARGVAAATLAFTWLNPAVYVDTVLVLGSVASTFHARAWWFGSGAAAASVLWFSALGFGAGLLAPLLGRPGAWRATDGLTALVMTGIGVRVLTGG